MRQAKNLFVIGYLCIGTNQIDLDYAVQHGIAVFNSPFSNSRNVAELVISQVVALARQYCEGSMEMHKGTWNKLYVLAEAMGMKSMFYDVVNLMSMGTAKQAPSLHGLLQNADFVTLHVPESPETKNLMGLAQFDQMKQGSYLINASCGCVVDIQAVIDALRSRKVAGATLDVYLGELAANSDYSNNELNTWAVALHGCKNIMLTPHIGGNTEEA